jgi:hypothetical protein
MSDHRSHRHGQGSLGTGTNHPIQDKGTSALIRHRPHTSLRDERVAPSMAEITRKRTQYLAAARAVSYGMYFESVGQSLEREAEEGLKKVGLGPNTGKLTRVQSNLGGAFLRMYLDHKVDPEIKKQAGEQIGASPEFKVLRDELEKYLQSAVNQSQIRGTETDKLRWLADAHLKAIKKHKGIEFRTNLNTVIGGVEGVDVESVENYNGASSGGVTTAKFHVNIRFSDVYHFHADRSKKAPEQDRFRKRLAFYLIANDFDNFEDWCFGEAKPWTIHRTHLDKATVFASFMYALERRGWTPGGLAWSVVVPADVSLEFKPHVHQDHHHPTR